jgi:regulator of replication initiation timing
MAGNTIKETNATAEEIASVLSSELQKLFLQVIALRIENEKLKNALKELSTASITN